jgi:hypothetical protein
MTTARKSRTLYAWGAAAAAVVLLGSLVSASGQASPPDRARTLAAIEAYRGIKQKFEQSSGPLARYMGFYSRGYRCEFNETTAGRPPGMWEKTQYALWADEKYLYGMTLDASPAVFQFEYRFKQNVLGMDVYELTRVDQLGAAGGIDTPEWQLLGFGFDDVIALRIPTQFLSTPDVHAVGWMTTCGQGSAGTDPFLDQPNPIYFSTRFLQKRLATLPAQ